MKTGNAFLRLDFQKLSHFRFKHKDNANGEGGSSGSLVLLLFTRFSRDCTEISLFGSSEVYRSRPDVLGRSARGPARTFSDVVQHIERLSRATCVTCQVVRRDSSAIKFDRVEIVFILALSHCLNH